MLSSRNWIVHTEFTCYNALVENSNSYQISFVEKEPYSKLHRWQEAWQKKGKKLWSVIEYVRRGRGRGGSKQKPSSIVLVTCENAYKGEGVKYLTYLSVPTLLMAPCHTRELSVNLFYTHPPFLNSNGALEMHAR